MKMQIDYGILLGQFIEIGSFKQNFVGIAANHSLVKKLKAVRNGTAFTFLGE